jgi:hypothetical protein
VWDEEIAFTRMMHANYANPSLFEAWRQTRVGSELWSQLERTTRRPSLLSSYKNSSRLGMRRAWNLPSLLERSWANWDNITLADLVVRFHGEAELRAMGGNFYDDMVRPDPEFSF